MSHAATNALITAGVRPPSPLMGGEGRPLPLWGGGSFKRWPGVAPHSRGSEGRVRSTLQMSGSFGR